MIITTEIKPRWVELTIEEGSAKINYDIWANELIDFKKQLENVIQDIDFMIEKLEIEGGKK